MNNIIINEILNSTNLKSYVFYANDRITFKFINNTIEKAWKQDPNAHSRVSLTIPIEIISLNNEKTCSIASLIISYNSDLVHKYLLSISTNTLLFSIIKLIKQ